MTVSLDDAGTWTDSTLVLSSEALRRWHAEPHFREALTRTIRARATERGISIDVYGEGAVCSWLELIEPEAPTR